LPAVSVTPVTLVPAPLVASPTVNKLPDVTVSAAVAEVPGVPVLFDVDWT
jgi:hypothetical protein